MTALAYHIITHLRMNGVRWRLPVLCVIGKQDAIPREVMLDFVMSCWDNVADKYHPDCPSYQLSTNSF